jgi:ABC-type branched-subunit amino acid transport system ATPase component
LLEAVDWDQRFKLPSPSLMGLVGPNPSGKFATFSVSTPKLGDVTAPEGFTIRVRDPGRDEREEGLFGGGAGGSDE